MSNVFTDIDNTELNMDENKKTKELMKNSNVVDDVTVNDVTLDNIQGHAVALDNIQGHAVDMFMKNSDGGITKVDGLNVTPEFVAFADKIFNGHGDIDANVQTLMMMTEIWTPPEEDDKASTDTETDIGVYNGDADTSEDTSGSVNDVTVTDNKEIPVKKVQAKKVTPKKDNTGKLTKKLKKKTPKTPDKQKKNIQFTASFGDITFSADF